MECHKCRFNGKGSVACLSCKGPDEKHAIGHTSSRLARGNMVSLEAMAEASGTIDHNKSAPKIRALGDYQASAPAFNCSDEAEMAVRRALEVLAQMDDKLALLFLGIVRGNTLKQVAARLGMSRNSIYEALKALRKSSPELAVLIGREDLDAVKDSALEQAQTVMDFGV